MRFFLMVILSLGLAGHVCAAGLQAPAIEKIELDGDELTIEFDRPMQTWNSSERQTKISTLPEVDCEWTWEDDTTIVCSTYKKVRQFKAASYYKVGIGEGFLSQEGPSLVAKNIIVSSTGPRLEARIVEWKNAFPIVVIESSLSVDAETLGKHLVVSLNDKNIPFKLVLRKKADNKENQEEHMTVQYWLELGSISDINALLKLSVKPGLKSSVGPVPGDQKESILSAKINEIFQLSAVSCMNEDQYTEVANEKLKSGAIKCNPQSDITLKFSRQLDDDSFAKLVAMLPNGFSLKKQELDRNYYRHDQTLPDIVPRTVYLLKSEQADTQFLLKFPKQMTSIEGKSLFTAPILLFDIGDYATKFTLTTSAKTLLPGQLSDAKLDVINSPIGDSHMGQLQISKDIKEKIRQISLVGTKNKVMQVDLLAADKDIQANGGLSLFGSEEFRDINYGVAYVPFNVLSYQSLDQVIVWTTQWQSGLPVAGAAVDILRLDTNRKLQNIATGITDKDGVAKINVSAALIQQDDLMSFVRVSSHGKTVVSPALLKANTRLNFKTKGYYSWYRSSNKSRDLLSFGVTELPLYRPGENVNYRIWLREKVGNHLQKTGRTLPADFQLYDINNQKVLQTWQSPLDKNDSVSSHLTLSRLLPDGYYCINATKSDSDRSGACFQVARFDSQPLWATISADKKSALAGQSIKFEMESGYFSGGPAANIELKFIGLSTSKRVEDQYPEFAAYSFINGDADDSEADGGDPLKGLILPAKTDAKGKAGFELRLDKSIPSGTSEAPPMAFGLLEFSAEVKIAGKASANSSTVAINYAQYPRYVGLTTKEWWLHLDKDAELEAVVITYDGKPVVKQAVIIKVYEYQNNTTDDNAQDAKKIEQKPVGECRLVSSEKSSCDFRANKAGRYVFKAESEGAASTEIVRYIGETYITENNKDKLTASLKLVQASDGKKPAKVSLDQPFENATALFTLEYDQIVYHWTQNLSKKQTEISIPVQQKWAPGLSLRAIIRPAKNSSAQAAKKIDTLDALLDIDIPTVQRAALLVVTSSAEYKPGEEIEITITNTSTQPSFATMSVIDDSVYQQGSEVWSFQDPNNENWLGGL